jgi:hypothetical protein
MSVGIFLPKPETRATDILPDNSSWLGDSLVQPSGATDAVRCLSRSACNPERELRLEQIFLFGLP